MTADKTPLYQDHLQLDGHMVDFHGTWLPMRYKSEQQEHLAVRNHVGIFDVSHMGEIILSGPKAAHFLQNTLTNDIDGLAVGQAHYTLMLNHQGGIIDDLIVYRLESDEFLLCVNAANIETDWQWLSKYSDEMAHLSLKNASTQYAQIAIQGPRSIKLLEKMFATDLPNRYHWKKLVLDEAEMLMARTGYTGEDGVEIFIEQRWASHLWQRLLEMGQEYNICPCGLAARDSLRIEAGLLLHGQDMSDATSPHEAGLMFAVKMNKTDFIGKRALADKIAQGLEQKLMGFQMDERGVGRCGYVVLGDHEQQIGKITSGTMVPTQKNAIGFAYIDADMASTDQKVYIDIRGRRAVAHLSKRNFLKQ